MKQMPNSDKRKITDEDIQAYLLGEGSTDVYDKIQNVDDTAASSRDVDEKENPDKKTVDGFLAHEVSSIVPEAISGEKDEVDKDNNPIYQGIDQSKLVPLLTKALQEAVAKIETLEAKVTALESK